MAQPAKKTVVSTFSMAMMTAAAVVSLRGLPMMAKEQLTLFAYIAFATFIFLIPAALVSAELGGAFAEKGGGVYTWVKEAFGARWGFVAIWLQWIQNVVWYPTVLAFSAAAAAYVFGRPELANNGTFVGIFCIAAYWSSTFVSLRGLDAIAKITSWTFLVGTVLPGVIIMILAVVWITQGNFIAMLHPTASDGASVMSMTGGHPHPRYFPNITGMGDIAFLAGIILLFAGVEVHAVHANEMAVPKRQFPTAILFASIVIILLFTLGSFAVATVLPNQDINLQEGLMKAFQQIFTRFGIGWATPIVCLLLAFGGIGGVMSWISGPSRGLLWTAQEGEVPPFLAKTNKHGVQVNILFVQAVIVTILTMTYFIMKDVSVAFFLLSAMTITAQLGAKSGAGGNVKAGLHEFMRDMLERAIGLLWAPDHHEVRLQTEAGAQALGYDARLYNLQQICSLALVRLPRRKRGLKDLALREARANVVDFPRKLGARGQRSSVAELVAVALVLLEPDFDALRDAPGLDASSISVRVAMDDLLNVKPEALIRPYYDKQSDIEVASQRDPEAMALAGLATMLTRIVFHVPLILEQGIDSIRFLLMTEANYSDADGAAAANLGALLTLGLLADGKREVAFVAQQH